MLNQNTLQAMAEALEMRGGLAELTPEQRYQNEYAAKLVQQLIDGDTIASLWTVEDVYSLTYDDDFMFEAGKEPSDISLADARRTLKAAEEDHDATIGINWDVLRFHLENKED
jgi:hypothetical protein